MTTDNTILFPPSRIVQGSLYKPNTTDAEGNPLVTKTGPNAGQPRVDFFFAIAIAKGAETHWNQTPWGQKIYATGVQGFPQGQHSRPDFAWKIEDGDSTVPNKKGVVPNTREGWKGHWVVKLSGGYAPKIYNSDGTQQLLEADYVKPGYFVEAYAKVESNDSNSQPGVYLNHSMVAFSGFGPEIHFGPDAKSVGFGKTALPAGVSQAPVGGNFNPATPPAVPAVTAPPPAQVAPPPNPAILQPPAVPAAPVRVMTAAAGGASYEQLIAAGWTDATLKQHGLMQ
jgi:hypothetical protein